MVVYRNVKLGMRMKCLNIEYKCILDEINNTYCKRE